MTVDELIEVLSEISKQGSGEKEITAFDPDDEAWQPVTNLTYSVGSGETVKIYTDIP